MNWIKRRWRRRAARRFWRELTLEERQVRQLARKRELEKRATYLDLQLTSVVTAIDKLRIDLKERQAEIELDQRRISPKKAGVNGETGAFESGETLGDA